MDQMAVSALWSLKRENASSGFSLQNGEIQASVLQLMIECIQNMVSGNLSLTQKAL